MYIYVLLLGLVELLHLLLIHQLENRLLILKVISMLNLNKIKWIYYLYRRILLMIKYQLMHPSMMINLTIKEKLTLSILNPIRNQPLQPFYSILGSLAAKLCRLIIYLWRYLRARRWLGRSNPICWCVLELGYAEVKVGTRYVIRLRGVLK